MKGWWWVCGELAAGRRTWVVGPCLGLCGCVESFGSLLYLLDFWLSLVNPVSVLNR